MAEQPAAVAGDADVRDAGTPANQILFTTIVAAPRLVESVASSLTQPVAAPTQVASAASLAVQNDDGSWFVPMHAPMEAFLYTSGPATIVRYNLQIASRVAKNDLIRRQPYLPGGGYSAADVLVLQPLGEVRLVDSPNLNVWRCEMACTGKSAHGKEPPNCQRVCGGVGCCLEGCTSGG